MASYLRSDSLISLDSYPDYDQETQNQNQQYENQIFLLCYRSSPSSFILNILNENGEQVSDPVTSASNHELEERLFKQ